MRPPISLFRHRVTVSRRTSTALGSIDTVVAEYVRALVQAKVRITTTPDGPVAYKTHTVTLGPTVDVQLGDQMLLPGNYVAEVHAVDSKVGPDGRIAWVEVTCW